MNPNAWLEKAERLRSTIAQIRDVDCAEDQRADHSPEILERVAIAHWLRQEFSDEPPEDTATLSLFKESTR
jgi:hypothetical protein